MGTWALLVDDGSGTYPNSVPFRSASVSRGRQDEMTAVQPGSAGFVIDDVDGTYAIGGVNAPGWWTVGARTRLTWSNSAGSVDVFHGALDSAPAHTLDKAGKKTQVTATFVDDTAPMQAKKLRSWIEEECLALAPLSYSPTCGSTWTTLPGGVDPTQDPDGLDVTSDTLNLAPITNTGSNASVVILLVTDTGGGGTAKYGLWDGSTRLMEVGLNATTGALTLQGTGATVYSMGTVPTSGQHVAVVTANNGYISVAIDGGTPVITLTGFGFSGHAVTKSTWTGTRSLFAHATVLLTEDLSPWPDVTPILTQLSGSYVTTTANANARLDALTRYGAGEGAAGYAPHASPPALTAQTIVASDALTQAQAVADSCDGIVFAAANGLLTLQTYGDRTATITAGPSSTLAGCYSPGLSFPNDKQHIVNAAVSAGSSGVQQHVANWPSIQANGQRDSAVASQLLLANDTDVMSILLHRLGGHATPTPERVSGLQYDINGIDAQAPSDALALLSLDIGGFHRNTAPPACSPVANLDVLIEGIAITIDIPAGTASVVFETSPTSLYSLPWILEDSVRGVLDSTTVLL